MLSMKKRNKNLRYIKNYKEIEIFNLLFPPAKARVVLTCRSCSRRGRNLSRCFYEPTIILLIKLDKDNSETVNYRPVLFLI